ncbi:MAG: transglutaminase domain-containing protein [Treponema sp.]|uniref:transglutaminase domain-containing protein n=1 Tax=Treponema sp. TaxID=166 RepID=UPI002A91C988|nr:IPT/TIG domain-containing protein [Treponema sp.]MDY6396996.1 transglutaminase domain-containing protein [Treponema sp.]
MSKETNKNNNNIKNIFSILFRKYSFFRVLSYVFIIVAALSAISVATVKSKKVPVIASVNPVVGQAGDTMVIRGSNFGAIRGTNYVEIGGNRITASGYLTWAENLIKLTIPSNVQDGLVVVVTKAGKSKPGFFANEAEIPVAVPKNIKTLQPVITEITPSAGSYGTLLTITGSDFGTARGESKVVFTANAEESSLGSGQGELEADFDFSTIAANESDYDYEYWSDSEIRVRIPDGAATGAVYVQTEKGKSNMVQEEIKLAAGEKAYLARKTYILQLNSDIDSIDTKNGTNITLRVPRPVATSWQPMVELTECTPEPVISEYKNTVIHQIWLKKATSKSEKIRFSHNFVVSTYAIQTKINEKAVKPYSQSAKARILFKNATNADSLIQSQNEEIKNLAKEIVTTNGKTEQNPYLRAKRIYDYIVQNYRLRDELRKSDASPLDLIKSKNGDAYDMAIFYTTLLRSLEIPSLPIAGILVDSEMKTRPHWWTEFYIEGFGWVPVDISLGMGLPYKSFRPVENNAEFYFGNLDGQHIAFSIGWNEIKQTISQNSKIVYRPKTYALQSIWEESSEGNVNYSSLWNDPIVLGLY